MQSNHGNPTGKYKDVIKDFDEEGNASDKINERKNNVISNSF